MNNKFILTEEVKNVFGITFHRIKAIRNFGDVEEGDLGGWVEKEENIVPECNAWVYGNALVYGDARVYGNAWVYGDARVYGNARVSGDAWVYGNTQVYGNAWVYGDARVYGNARVSGDAQVYGGKWEQSPLYIQGTKYSVCMHDETHIKIGCQIHTFKQWKAHGESIAKANGFTEIELEEYRLYVELAIKRYAKLEADDANPAD